MTGSVQRKMRVSGGGPQPFQTDREVVRFATKFLRDRSKGFKKDIDICLTSVNGPKGKKTHAYMPALLLCFSFIDLLSGLYAGNIRRHGLNDFVRYMKQFTPANRYNDYDLTVLYVGFRHKIAHLSHPYLVLDTAKEKQIGGAPKRLAWTICAARRKKPLEIIPGKANRTIKSHPTPWPVSYDHVMKISIAALAADARSSLKGPTGYLVALQSDPNIRRRFKKCMREFFA
jgi:hypothetical protein